MRSRKQFPIGLQKFTVKLVAAVSVPSLVWWGLMGPTHSQPAKTSAENIRIGLIASLTGSTATFGVSTLRGVELAFSEINARGGVLGQKLELIAIDNGSNTAKVPDTVTELIEERKVFALIGEVASSRSLAAAPIAQHAGVPMVSPSSTNPRVTKVGDYVFRTCIIDPAQGAAMAQFARWNLKKQKAAVLTDVANDYSKGLAESFVVKWKRLGGRIVAQTSYTEGDTDFREQLMLIKAASPDVIYLPGYYTETANIAVQARRLGIRTSFIGADGWSSPRILAFPAIQGTYITEHFSEQSRDPRVIRFVNQYQQKYRIKPDALAASAYDAARVLANAITRAGSLDRAQVRDALASTQNFPGLTGNISIDRQRNGIKPLVILKIDGSQLKYVTTINPF